ncbi:MAG: DUF2232 domain-containing protein [Pseudomonadota bacterium]
MTKPLIIAIVAGLAAALLYLSVATGSVLSVLLFYLAPLPLFVAGLGWGLPVGIVAMLVATGAALILGPLPSFTFLLTIGAPTLWLIRLALLARPDENGDPVWYPAERLVLWTAALATGLVLVALPMIGFGSAEFRADVEALVAQMFAVPELTDPPVGDGAAGEAGAQIADTVVRLLPVMASLTWMMITLFNLWLAARIAKASKVLMRPWPRLRDIDFPPSAALAFGAAVVASFAPGWIGTIGQVASGTLAFAFLLLGLAVLHSLVANHAMRRAILIGIYFILIVTPFSVVALFMIVGLGVAEALTNVRARRGPPAPPSTPPAPPGAV